MTVHKKLPTTVQKPEDNPLLNCKLNTNLFLKILFPKRTLFCFFSTNFHQFFMSQRLVFNSLQPILKMKTIKLQCQDPIS